MLPPPRKSTAQPTQIVFLERGYFYMQCLQNIPPGSTAFRVQAGRSGRANASMHPLIVHRNDARLGGRHRPQRPGQSAELFAAPNYDVRTRLADEAEKGHRKAGH